MERFGRTPAHIAAENGHADLVRVRAELGANVDTPKNMAPRQPAWRHITADQMLRVLSELGANLETPDNDGAFSANLHGGSRRPHSGGEVAG